MRTKKHPPIQSRAYTPVIYNKGTANAIAARKLLSKGLGDSGD